MANKRNLKKAVKASAGYLAGECIFTRELVPGADKKKLNDAIIKIADMQYEAVKGASFSYDKSPRSFDSKKEYNKARRQYFAKAYDKLRKTFNNGVDEVVEMMNDAMPKKKAE